MYSVFWVLYRMQKIEYRQGQSLRLFSCKDSEVNGLLLALADLAVSESPIHVDVNEPALTRMDICTVLQSPKQAERAATHSTFLVLLRTAEPSPASALEFEQPELLTFHSSSSASLHLCVSLPTRAHHPSQPRFSTGLMGLEFSWTSTRRTKAVQIHLLLPPGQNAISDDAVSSFHGLCVSPITHFTSLHRKALDNLHGRCSLLLMVSFSSRWPSGPLFSSSESEGILRNARQRISVLAHLNTSTNPKRSSRLLDPPAFHRHPCSV